MEGLLTSTPEPASPSPLTAEPSPLVPPATTERALIKAGGIRKKKD
jgi:hypothetical protein